MGRKGESREKKPEVHSLRTVLRRVNQLEICTMVLINVTVFVLVRANRDMLTWAILLAALLVANISAISTWRTLRHRSVWFYLLTRDRLEPFSFAWWREYHFGQLRPGRRYLGGHWERWWIDAPVYTYVWLSTPECYYKKGKRPSLGRHLFGCETWEPKNKIDRTNRLTGGTD